MNCTDFIQHLGACLDGESSGSHWADVQEHISLCSGCRTLVVSCRETIAVYRRQAPPQVPAALHHKVMQKLAAERLPSPRRAHPSS